jgi:mannose-6-phosphate isomerase-like protein (cupin superfamily)
LNGNGEVQVENETAPILKGDAVPVLLNQVHSIRNDATQDLELMIRRHRQSQGKLDTVEVK